MVVINYGATRVHEQDKSKIQQVKASEQHSRERTKKKILTRIPKITEAMQQKGILPKRRK